jgi:hypothetical protein
VPAPLAHGHVRVNFICGEKPERTFETRRGIPPSALQGREPVIRVDAKTERVGLSATACRGFPSTPRYGSMRCGATARSISSPDVSS